MDPHDFRTPETGRFVRAPGGYWAFVPAPPPALAYEPDTVLLLSNADTALAELSAVGQHLPNPHLLIAPYVRREAVLSSRIEGTQTNLAELLLDEVDPKSVGQDPDDVREVRNYITALDHGIRRLKKLPLSLRLVRDIHGALMKGVRGEYATPGEFRRSQNWIGSPGSKPEAAVYVPPPPLEMMEALADWEKFLHRRGEMPDLVQCALLHEYFEAIHPFLDGNGRIGRLLIILFLIERRRLAHPLLYLSDFFEKHRSEYYQRLSAVRRDADWMGWIRFFLSGVIEVSREGILRAKRLTQLRQTLLAKVGDQAKTRALLDHLFQNPYITVAGAVKVLKTSNPTARQAVNRLLEAGVLQEITGRPWRQVFLAKPILTAITETLSQG